jgi:hypothetical protein
MAAVTTPFPHTWVNSMHTVELSLRFLSPMRATCPILTTLVLIILTVVRKEYGLCHMQQYFKRSAVSHRIFCSPDGAIWESLRVLVEGFLHTFGRVELDGRIELLVHKSWRCPSAKRHLVLPACTTESSFTDAWSAAGKLVQCIYPVGHSLNLPQIFPLG